MGGSPRLFGRAAEMATIAQAVGSVCGGVGRCVLIEGEPGIGKTALLEVAATVADDGGVPLLRARGTEIEREIGFGLARQLLEPLLSSASPEDRAGLLAGAATHAAAVIDPHADPGPSSPDEAAVTRGLYWVIANLCLRGPLALLVDDAQWSDPYSMRWLGYLAARIEGLPVLLVVASHPSTPGQSHNLRDVLCDGPMTSVIEPDQLSAGAVNELVSEMYPRSSVDFRAACHTHSRGNPFLLTELLRAVEADGITTDEQGASRVAGVGPQGVARGVIQRVERLGPDAVALAEAVAVLGTGRVALPHAALLAGVELTRAADIADGLVDSAIFAGGSDLSYRHPLIGRAVFRSLRPHRLAVDRMRAARILDSQGESAEVVASHLLGALPAADAWVVDRLTAAADLALRRGAVEPGVRYLTRALAEPPADDRRAITLWLLGMAEAGAVRSSAQGHLTEALAASTNSDERLAIALTLAPVMAIAGRVKDGLAQVRRIVVETQPQGDLAGLARAAESILAALTGKPDLPPTFDAPENDSAPVRAALATSCAFRWVMMAEGRANAVRFVETAWEDPTALIQMPPSSPVTVMSLLPFIWSDEFDRARVRAEALMRAAEEQGSGWMAGSAEHALATISFRTGNLPDALHNIRRTSERTAHHGSPLSHVGTLTVHLTILVAMGRLGEAQEVIDRVDLARDLFESTEVSPVFSRLGQCRLWIARGDFDAAISELERLGRRCELAGVNSPSVFPWRSMMAEALLGLGRRDEAVGFALEEVELARSFGAPRALATALRVAGMSLEGPRALESLRAAVAVAADSPARLTYAETLVELGAALRRSGHKVESREPLRLGLDLARRCGATPLADRAMTELRASGARPRRAAASGVDALTPSELRVCELAASGKSNPDIARQLYVSRKTVEAHLAGAYAKLGVAGRGELAGVLAVSAVTGQGEMPSDPNKLLTEPQR